jgi:hypothetical protein
MTINRGFNLSASVSETGTDDGSGEASTLVDTYGVSATVSTGPIESNSNGFGAAVSADATAIGEDTFSSVSASGHVSAGAVATSAEVSLTTEAVATSGGQSYASATGSVELIGGADWSFSLSYDSSTIDQEVDGTTAISSSIDYLYALNIDESGISVPSPSDEVVDEGIPATAEATPPVQDPADYDPCGCGSDSGIPFDGNVAVYEVDFEAFADNAVIEVDMFALAVEDQMSSVTLGSIIMIG